MRLAAALALCLAAGWSGPGLAADGDRPATAGTGDAAAPDKTGDAGATAETGRVDLLRFGQKTPDPAFGAFQRGLYITAYNLALPRAREGDAPAQALVAEILSRGLGVARDPVEAANWYGKAAEAGIPEAQFQYALVLLDGKYAAANPERAFRLMKAAADAGSRLAQFNFAQLLTDRRSGGAGLDEAVAYYEKAAEAGLADAQYAMAQVLANGVGGRAVDVAGAMRWLTLAARQNYDTAQLDLGTWLVDGRGGTRDYEAGFGWIKRAAEGGNVAARNRLAKLYVHALGTEPDPILAAAWYISARRAGLRDFEMDDFLQGLTPEEQKQAIERANRLR
jgi:TPR repeat protein